MHLCNPDDHQTCTAWCEGDIHVDVAYCDPALLAAIGVEAIPSFRVTHTMLHTMVYRTPACTILDMAPAPEAPSAEERYHYDSLYRDTSAYRVTYQVHHEARQEEVSDV